MSDSVDKILDDALRLPPAHRATLVEALLSSLARPDPDIYKLWASEAEARIDAAERGEMRSVSAAQVFGKYEQR